MPALLTTDYLAAEAQTIFTATGKAADLKVSVTDARLLDGQHMYYLHLHNYLGIEKTFCQPAAADVLAELAAYTGCAWPIAFATAEQQEQATRLLNHPVFSATEKAAFLAELPAWATAYAAQRLAELRQEGLRRVAAERGFAVKGTAEILPHPAAQAA